MSTREWTCSWEERRTKCLNPTVVSMKTHIPSHKRTPTPSKISLWSIRGKTNPCDTYQIAFSRSEKCHVRPKTSSMIILSGWKIKKMRVRFPNIKISAVWPSKTSTKCKCSAMAISIETPTLRLSPMRISWDTSSPSFYLATKTKTNQKMTTNISFQGDYCSFQKNICQSKNRRIAKSAKFHPKF